MEISGVDMEAQPVFTVVIPTYNRAKIIGRTLQSVFDQDFANFEVVVVDDGSTDDTIEFVKSIKDPRLRLITQRNTGGGAARNAGIREAKGHLIALLDSDDLFMPSKLRRCFEEHSGDGCSVLYSSMNVDRGVEKFWVRPDRGIRDNEDVGEYLFCANQLIQTSTIIVPRELAQKILFDPTLKRGQDLDFCIRLQAAGAKFRMIDEPLTVWHDATEFGRTSYVSGYEASSKWLEKCAPLLTLRAIRGYRATVLAYHLARVKPLTAMYDLALGWTVGHVPTKVVLRQILRAYLPRSVYRSVVNRFVSRFGVS